MSRASGITLFPSTTSLPRSHPPRPGAPYPLGSTLARRKQGCSLQLSGPTGKCMSELQTVLLAGTRPLRLSGYHGCKHLGQPSPAGPHAGPGEEIPNPSFHVQSTPPHGSPLVRTMGPRSHCLPATGNGPLHRKTNQGGFKAHRTGYKHNRCGLLERVQRYGQRS